MNAKSTFADVVTTGSLTDQPATNLPTPQEISEHGDAKIIAIFNQKGGVGKTTLARILKSELECGDLDFVEVNAAMDVGIVPLIHVDR